MADWCRADQCRPRRDHRADYTCGDSQRHGVLGAWQYFWRRFALLGPWPAAAPAANAARRDLTLPPIRGEARAVAFHGANIVARIREITLRASAEAGLSDDEMLLLSRLAPCRCSSG